MTRASASPAQPFGLLRLPDQISYGVGAVDHLAVATAALGKRVFVCCDPFLATTPDFIGVSQQLTGAALTVDVCTDVVPELPVESVQRVAEIARIFAPDVVIGYGGGSAMDLAKLVALLVTHGGNLRDYYGENAVPGPVLPLIAVPTTAGTGSEVTPVAVISDPERELKVGVSSPFLIPRQAIVDPQLTLGVPATVTAHSGIDAFVHAVESFTAGRRPPQWQDRQPVFVGRNDLSSLLALEAIRAIGSNLRQAVAEPEDLAAREAMAYGSLLAGMAFGTGGTHLSHAIQYPVGAITKTPHGLGTGMLLPYVLQACLPNTEEELGTIGGALGIGDDPQAAIEAVAALVKDIGIPTSLVEIGISEDQLPRISELSRSVGRLASNATVQPTEATVDAILRAAWSGDRQMIIPTAQSVRAHVEQP